MLRFILAVAAFTLATMAFADVYRSVDAQGQVQYSDQWSPGAQLIKGDRDHPVVEPDTSGGGQKKPAPSTDQSAEAAKQAAAKAVQADVAAARADQCKKLQEAYDKLVLARRILVSDPGPNGERQYMTDEQADQERVRTRQARDEVCGPPSN